MEKKHTKKKKHKIHKTVILAIPLGFLVFLLSFFAFSFRDVYATRIFDSSAVALSFVTPTMMPSPTATPTAMPTPTPVYTGYCLRIPILLYHHVQPQQDAVTKGQTSLSVDNGMFDQQMAYVAAHYTTVTAEQVVNALRTHTALPANSMLITLDDGYQDAYTYAYPIFQKHHVLATLMIPSGLLNNSSGSNAYMSWDNLKQMAGSGLITITDHTWSHYSVGSGSPDKDQYEIMTAKKQLEDNLGKQITLFTYPYGSGGTLPRVVALLRQDGFVGAFSTIPGSIQCDSFIFDLHRTHIGNSSLPSYGF